ncbi:TPA: SMEK domain-containing protein, partial [Campylobacter jejuni]|nr:SMEK domain-containing protein [Campylobacter jejuni]
MEDIIKIIQWFSELSSKIKLSNKLNLTDINICCENDFSQILNNIYNWKLYNINKQCKNAEAIDLIDNENRIAIQITSNTSTKKIKNTIDKFKKTKFSNYEFYMFYLTDDLPNNTKKNISQNNIKSLCFLDLIQELHFN